MNYFLLPNQELCAIATIMKFELIWEEKYVAIF